MRLDKNILCNFAAIIKKKRPIMATITLQYDGRNTAFKQLIQLFLTLGGRIVEDTEPKYDPEMVAKVRKGREDFRKGKCVTIKASEIWN